MLHEGKLVSTAVLWQLHLAYEGGEHLQMLYVKNIVHLQHGAQDHDSPEV